MQCRSCRTQGPSYSGQVALRNTGCRILLLLLLALASVIAVLVLHRYTLYVTNVFIPPGSFPFVPPRFATKDKAARFALITIAIGNFSYKRVSLINKRAYCVRHGIDCHFITRPLPPPPPPPSQDAHSPQQPTIPLPHAWQKVLALYDLLPLYDWVWLIDLDAMIMNQTMSLATLVAKAELQNPAVEMVYACDYDEFVLNSGSLLIKRGKVFTPTGILEWMSYSTKNVSMWDQGGLKAMLQQDVRGIRTASVRLPMADMNMYCPEHMIPKMRWQPGMFVVHFPGQCKKRLVPFVQSHLQEIIAE